MAYDDEYYYDEEEEDDLDETMEQIREMQERERAIEKAEKKSVKDQSKKIKKRAARKQKAQAAKKSAKAAGKIAKQAAAAAVRALVQAIAYICGAILAAIGWIGVVIIIVAIIIIGPVLGLVGGGGGGGGGPTGNPVADARVGNAPGPIASVVTVSLGNTVFFDGSAFSSDPDGVITLYEWDFEGDGTYDWSNAGIGVTNYIYPAIGNFSAFLRVTDNDAKTDTDIATVNIIPVGVFAATITLPIDGQSFAQGENITFTGVATNGTAPYIYSWTSSIDMGIGNTNTFNRNDLSPGNHTITLMITDSAAATDTDSISISVVTDSIPPTILNSVIVPTSGPIGTVFTITGDIADSSGVDLTTTKAHIQNPDETDFAVIDLYDDGAHSDGVANDGTFGNTWTSTAGGSYYVDITACDIFGNCAEDENI